jgi:putative hydrolase of the HAD superfamily
MTWLLFDYGGVISEPQPAEDLATLASLAGVAADPVRDAYWKYRLDYDLGVLDAETYWAAVGGEVGFMPDGKKLADLVRLDVASWMRWRPGVVDLVETLGLSARYRLALLSNAPGEVGAALTASPLAGLFEQLIFSCDLGLAKPDRQCFVAALARLGAAAGDVIFVDDRLGNVEAAHALGLQALHFSDEWRLRTDLAEALAPTV